MNWRGGWFLDCAPKSYICTSHPSGDGGGGGACFCTACTWLNPTCPTHFDGNTYLDSGAPAIVDTTSFAFSVWVDLATFQSIEAATQLSGGVLIGLSNLELFSQPWNRGVNFIVRSSNASASINFRDSLGPAFYEGDQYWINVLCAGRIVSLGGTSYRRDFYVYYNDDQIDAQADSFTDAGTPVFQLGGSNWRVGGNTFYSPTSFPYFNGCIDELWFAAGQYVDLTDATVRLKFHVAGPNPNQLFIPASLGAAGATPTGVAPSIYSHGKPADFLTNHATGGTWVVHGDALGS